MKTALTYRTLGVALLGAALSHAADAAVSSFRLGQFQGITAIAASYNGDDDYRVVEVATSDGNITELFYKSAAGQPPGNVGRAVIGNLPGVVNLAAFYAGDDHYRIVLAATASGDVWEIFYHPQKQGGRSVIAHFDGIVGIAGFYNQDDNYRVLLAATRDGAVHEVFYHPTKGRGQGVLLQRLPGIKLLAGSFGSNRHPQDRRAVVVLSSGQIREYAYHPQRGLAAPVSPGSATGLVAVAAAANGAILGAMPSRLVAWQFDRTRPVPGLPGAPSATATSIAETAEHMAADGHDGRLVYSTTDGQVIGRYVDWAVPAAESPVTVYEHADFAGRKQSYGIGSYRADLGQLDAVGNDTISSIRVAEGYGVKLCQQEGAGHGAGTCLTLWPGDHGFVESLNDEVSYIEIFACGKECGGE